MTNDNNECDIVHNMCGWFIQFVSNNHTYSTRLDKVTTELQACSAAHGMGFDSMSVWEYERHIKDVSIPKQTLGKAEHNGNGNNGNGMHLSTRSLQRRSQCQGVQAA